MQKLILCVLAVIFVAAVALTVRFYMLGKQSAKSVNAGLVEGQLQACPNRPSCVCSTDTREQFQIAPLAVPAGMEQPIAGLAELVGQFERTQIVEQRDDYLHVTFTTKLFRFVDDVEFLLDGDVVQVRSVSRVGYSDLGVNRKRVEAIRERFN